MGFHFQQVKIVNNCLHEEKLRLPLLFTKACQALLLSIVVHVKNNVYVVQVM